MVILQDKLRGNHLLKLCAMNNYIRQNIDLTKLFFLMIISFYFIYCLNYSSWHLIDSVDLIIHEAGHWIFIIFGEFVQVLGGSLNQLIIPLIFVGYFIIKKDFYSASILFIWFGYSLINVSVYIADAYYMRLPLLGGDGVIHDWNYILSSINLLRFYNSIANVVKAIGIFSIIIGILGGLMNVFGKKVDTVTNTF